MEEYAKPLTFLVLFNSGFEDKKVQECMCQGFHLFRGSVNSKAIYKMLITIELFVSSTLKK